MSKSIASSLLALIIFASETHATTLDLSAWDSNKIARGSIDTKSIARIGSMLIFVGSWEPLASVDSRRWYDLVAFDCVERTYKVLMTIQKEGKFYGVGEFVLDPTAYQSDAVSYGSTHAWDDVKTIATRISSQCGKAPPSHYTFLPYQFGEGQKTIWWADLATMESAGAVKTFYVHYRNFDILDIQRGASQYKQVFVSAAPTTTHRWMIDCKASTISMLLTVKHDERGNVMESDRTPAAPQDILPQSLARKAQQLVCKL